MVGSNRIHIPVNLQMNVFTIQEVTSEFIFQMLAYFFTLVLEGRIVSKVSNFFLFQIN